MPEEQPLLNLIASNRQGILAGVTRAGYPHLTNVLYTWDAEHRLARISTTAERVKARILRRDARAALHVGGDHFWAYAVAECDAEVSPTAAEPGDDTCRELLEVHSSFYSGIGDEAAFFSEMIAEQRLIVRLRVQRAYGVVRDGPPGM
jgi:PPOX class probable F420-dependent enzyme